VAILSTKASQKDPFFLPFSNVNPYFSPTMTAEVLPTFQGNARGLTTT